MTQANLLVIEGKNHGNRYDLTGRRYQIGRGSLCQIRVTDNLVSRAHATIQHKTGNFTLLDNNSSNGTLVNGKPVAEHSLTNGDRIQVGETVFLFTCDEFHSSQEIAASRISFVRQAPEFERSRIVGEVSDRTVAAFTGVNPAEGIAEQAEMVAQLTTLYQITEEVVRPTLSPDQLLDRILYLTTEVVGADRGCVLLFSPEGGKIIPRVFIDRTGQSERMPVSMSIVDYVVKKGQGVRTSDAQTDQRFDHGQSIFQAGVREAMCVPLQGRDDLLGVVYVDTTMTSEEMLYRSQEGSHFSDSKLRLLIAIGGQAALAIENHRYQNALLKAERLAAMGQTIAMLSHHIKNIMQGIRGGSYLVNNGLNDMNEELLQKGWQIVEKNQNRIYNLVMDMLTFSKERAPAYCEGDVNKLATDVEELVKGKAEEAHVIISLDLDTQIPPAWFDEEGIHRALLNIVSNAIDAVAEKQGDEGEVQIATEYDANRDRISITVEDNGPGIPAPQLEKVFNMFESTKGSRGTGLGLAVSQKILHEHNGEITVESRPGLGCKFTLNWPRMDDEHRIVESPTMA
ncbi:Sporulation kinase E [Polystyrenella longa]|uniref:histidine kinase n=1 Tax=Polystyrenella longa TaxID=2528007 RepID=A0A518CMJ6_9PLAN|nr:ATP-binding protein [Polystyrenella longa]QDU80449.1 Sporulation kinase E [Polystyrenella longa]